MKNNIIHVVVIDIEDGQTSESRPVGAFRSKKEAQKSISLDWANKKCQIGNYKITKYWIEGVTLY